MTTKGAEQQIFLDTNILVRANVATAPDHQQVIALLRVLRKRRTLLWISQQIIREYIATVTRPQTFMKPLDIATALGRARYFQTHFRVAQDNSLVLGKLFDLLTAVAVGGKQIHDANIVATMQVYSLKSLLTLNPADFNRFLPYINVLSPEAALVDDRSGGA